MNKLDWYKDRLLWRIKKNKLLDSDYVHRYEIFSESKKILIEQLLGEKIKPCFVFWGGSNKWTVLCNDSIYSFHNGSLGFCKYDDIQKCITVKRPKLYNNNKELKENVEYIYLEKPDIYVWAPKGRDLIGLMNVLLMFPLSFKPHTIEVNK